MNTFFKKILAYIIYKVAGYITWLYNYYNSEGIKHNKAIILGNNVSINHNARLETINGGKITIGDNAELRTGVLLITYGGDIEIGKNTAIGPYTIIYGLGGAFIGDNVMIAGHCMIIPDSHNFEDINTPIKSQGTVKSRVKINQNVWLGHGCSILAGVEIETGAVIAAGSVVDKNVAKNSVVSGVPAKVIYVIK